VIRETKRLNEEIELIRNEKQRIEMQLNLQKNEYLDFVNKFRFVNNELQRCQD
jgi:hypothetical protein